jgi:Putative restriction endonuclease
MPDHLTTIGPFIAARPIPARGRGYTHGTITLELACRLRHWASGRGTVSLWWGFRPRRGETLIAPDIAYLSNHDGAAQLSDNAIEEPQTVPTVAVVVAGYFDRARHIASRTRRYLDAGVPLVVVVDSRTRTIFAETSGGVQSFHDGEVFKHACLPDFMFSMSDLNANRGGSQRPVSWNYGQDMGWYC